MPLHYVCPFCIGKVMHLNRQNDSNDSNASSTMLIRCKLVSGIHRSPRHASIVPNILFSTGKHTHTHTEPSHVLTFAIKKQPQGRSRTSTKNNHKDENMGAALEWLCGNSSRDRRKRKRKKISAANDLCAIEINPKFIYFYHKPECSQGKKDFWPLCVCSVCGRHFVVPVFVFELSAAATKAMTMATNYKSVGN